VSERDTNLEIYVMDADGGNPVRLTETDEWEYLPAWSPDGEQIAFLSNRDNDAEIYVMNVDGSNPVRLTDAEGFDSTPTWTADGTHIIFLTDRDGNQEVYRMTATGGNPTNLTNNPVMDDGFATIAPDGTIVYRTRITNNVDIHDMNDLLLVYGLASIFISTALVVAAMLLLVREGLPPFGAMTIVWTVTFALIATQDDGYGAVALAFATGLMADILLRVLKVRVEQGWRFIGFAFLVPVIYFTLYFIMFQVMVGEINWSIDVWTGSVFLAGIVGVLIAAIILPREASAS
jgi:hypothetical protein